MVVVAEVPPGVVTVTLTVPADSVGDVAVISLPAELTMTEVAALDPKSTVVAPAIKPVPVIVTAVPPLTNPVFGLTPVIVGTGS